jgi:glycerol-3-phosphate dehydrogenase
MPVHDSSIRVDALIFGGGVAGLWLLDELRRRGVSALLLEAGSLGHGQTVASQGILHGGLKYTLQGLLTQSAAHIRDMPALWRDCLAGKREPDLSETPLRAEFCHLWRTDGVASKLGMIGAKIGLRVAPQNLSREDRPPILSRCPGTVAVLDEQVISPAGLIANLARRNRERILRVNNDSVSFQCRNPGQIDAVTVQPPIQSKPEAQAKGEAPGPSLALQASMVVFTAGAGNAALRERAGLSTNAMQLRPLHMVVARGDLPELNGHCVDGKKTRVTITSDVDTAGCRVWQIGGQVSEDGVAMESAELIAHAQEELRAVIPGIELVGVDWSTYRVNRAEGTTRNGRRPETIQILREGNTITAWPTKLVLAPKLAEVIADEIASQGADRNPLRQQGIQPFSLADASGYDWPASLRDWPRPEVALPPWETRSVEFIPRERASRVG